MESIISISFPEPPKQGGKCLMCIERNAGSVCDWFFFHNRLAIQIVSRKLFLPPWKTQSYGWWRWKCQNPAAVRPPLRGCALSSRSKSPAPTLLYCSLSCGSYVSGLSQKRTLFTSKSWYSYWAYTVGRMT